MKSPEARLILGIALASQGLYLLNQGVFWDGWIHYWLAKDPHAAGLFDFFSQQGSVFTGLMLWVLGAFTADVILFRMAYLISIGASSLLFYRLLTSGFGLPKKWAAIAASLTVVSPFCVSNFEISIMPYWVYIALFFLGIELLQRRQANSLSFRQRLALGIAGDSLLLISFSYSALLFLFPAYPLMLWQTHAKKRQMIKNNLDTLAVPFVFWFFRQTVFRPSGHYEGYNRPHFSKQAIQSILASPIEYVGQLGWVLRDLLGWPSVLCTAAVAIPIGLALTCLFRKKSGTFSDAKSKFLPLKVSAFGFVFMWLARAPYAFLDRKIDFYFWPSRDHIPVIFGFSLVLTGAMMAVWRAKAPKAVPILLFSALISCLISFHIRSSIFWIVQDLRQRAQIFHYQDSDRVRSARLLLFSNEGMRFSPYELAGQLKMAFGDEKRIAWEDPGPSEPASPWEKRPFYYLMRQAGSDAPKIKIRVLREENGIHWGKLVLGYLVRRYEWDPGFRDQVKGLIHFEILP